jgi:hypothetical protein
MMFNEYGADGGMRVGRGIPSTQRKSVALSLSPQQITHDLTPLSNPARCNAKLEIRDLNYGAATSILLSYSNYFLP